MIRLAFGLAVLPLALSTDILFDGLNGWAGQSRWLDSLADLAEENLLLKAGLIGACFCAAWFGRFPFPPTSFPHGKKGEGEEPLLRARKILLATLLAAALSVGITKWLSGTLLLPRPFVLSHRAYVLEGDELKPLPRWKIRVPQVGFVHDLNERLARGDLRRNDLGSFPSDHAGFYVAIAGGIWLAWRPWGWLALGWTFGVILASKIFAGLHGTVDVLAGTTIALTVLALCQLLARWRPGKLLEWLARWTLAHPVLASGLLFLVLFEVSSTLGNVPSLLRFALLTVRSLLGMA